MTLDGKLATHTGDSRWISGEASRADRARSSAAASTPSSSAAARSRPTIRCSRRGRRARARPTRIVLDSQASLPLDSQLVRTAARGAGARRRGDRRARRRAATRCDDRGVEVWQSAAADRNARLAELLDELGRRQMTNVLVEGGAEVLGRAVRLGRDRRGPRLHRAEDRRRRRRQSRSPAAASPKWPPRCGSSRLPRSSSSATTPTSTAASSDAADYVRRRLPLTRPTPSPRCAAGRRDCDARTGTCPATCPGTAARRESESSASSPAATTSHAPACRRAPRTCADRGKSSGAIALKELSRSRGTSASAFSLIDSDADVCCRNRCSSPTSQRRRGGGDRRLDLGRDEVKSARPRLKLDKCLRPGHGFRQLSWGVCEVTAVQHSRCRTPLEVAIRRPCVLASHRAGSPNVAQFRAASRRVAGEKPGKRRRKNLTRVFW